MAIATMEAGLDDALAYLLDLRLRCRGNREATALVDRGLSLLAQAQGAEADERRRLEAEIESLRRELEARFGPRSDTTRH